MSTETQTPRITIPITDIQIGERIRQDFGDLDELIQTFKDNEAIGKPRLIHPVVVDSDMNLIDGGRRIAAHEKAGYTEIDVAFFGALDRGEAMRLEVDANKHKPFNWIENVLAIDRYHTYYKTKAALESKPWGLRETGKLLGYAASPVFYASTIAALIRKNDPDILKCTTLNEAIGILADRREKEANKLLVAKTAASAPQGVSLLQTDLSKLDKTESIFSPFPTIGAAVGFTPGIGLVETSNEMPGQSVSSTSAPTIPISQMLYHVDCLTFLTGETQYDHIITDIPYGIDMTNLAPDGHGMNNIDSVRDEHDVSANIELIRNFFPAAYASLKDKGFLITWCDQMLWQYMYDLAIAQGFSVQRWPLIWHKTSNCKNQAPNQNFTKNYEIAMVCRKGTAMLLQPETSSIWQGSNDVETKLLGHPFAKPAGLWTWLFEAVCQKGQTICDPFAGVGSSTLPAIRYGLTPITCEINEDHYNRQVVNVQNLYMSLDKNVKFS